MKRTLRKSSEMKFSSLRTIQLRVRIRVGMRISIKSIWLRERIKENPRS